MFIVVRFLSAEMVKEATPSVSRKPLASGYSKKIYSKFERRTKDSVHRVRTPV